ncbi:MAG: FCD domain-containing protein, partial [Hyphomicrobium sp.]|nr:FCD domain-containing protein [Hyphomicrobium sp.]
FGNGYPAPVSKSATEAAFSKAAFRNTEEFIEDRFPVDVRFDMRIDCEVIQNGFRPTLLLDLLERHGILLRKKSLRFFIADSSDLPADVDIYWKVLNRGDEAERRAIRMDDVPLRNRLLGTFHVRIAEMVGNKVLTEILADLVTRSSLITLLLQSTQAASCSSDEHRALIAAIRARKAPLVQKLLREHLDHVERDLADIDGRGSEFDLADALGPAAAERKSKAPARRVRNGSTPSRGRVPSQP